MKKINYKVGDKVLLKNKRGHGWNEEGKMDCYMGKVVTISELLGCETFNIKEDNDRIYSKWLFGFDDIERKITQKHFKSLPKDYTGTIEIENGFIVEKEILDDVEKEYLRALIKPFRNRIKYIRKSDWINKQEYIAFNMKDEPSSSLPLFKKNTMYKGMELNKNYTLKELGLDDNE